MFSVFGVSLIPYWGSECSFVFSVGFLLGVNISNALIMITLKIDMDRLLEELPFPVTLLPPSGRQ